MQSVGGGAAIYIPLERLFDFAAVAGVPSSDRHSAAGRASAFPFRPHHPPNIFPFVEQVHSVKLAIAENLNRDHFLGHGLKQLQRQPFSPRACQMRAVSV